MLGDGTFSKSRNVYYTSSKALAYDVATLAKLGGYTCNVLGGTNGYYYEHNENSKSIVLTAAPPMWQVQITKRKINNYFYFDYYKNNRNGNIYDIEQPKQVVCFTVPNGTLVTMFNGKSAVQGNCKQLHHIKRVEDYLERYIAGEPYIDCLYPKDPEYLMMIKKGLFNESDATSIAEIAMEHIDKMADEFCERTKPEVNQEAIELLNSVQASIVKKSLVRELQDGSQL